MKLTPDGDTMTTFPGPYSKFPSSYSKNYLSGLMQRPIRLADAEEVGSDIYTKGKGALQAGAGGAQILLGKALQGFGAEDVGKSFVQSGAATRGGEDLYPTMMGLPGATAPTSPPVSDQNYLSKSTSSAPFAFPSDSLLGMVQRGTISAPSESGLGLLQRAITLPPEKNTRAFEGIPSPVTPTPPVQPATPPVQPATPTKGTIILKPDTREGDSRFSMNSPAITPQPVQSPGPVAKPQTQSFPGLPEVEDPYKARANFTPLPGRDFGSSLGNLYGAAMAIAPAFAKARQQGKERNIVMEVMAKQAEQSPWTLEATPGDFDNIGLMFDKRSGRVVPISRGAGLSGADDGGGYQGSVAASKFPPALAQSDQPPAPGARKAPDGNWYVKNADGWLKVTR